MQRSQRGRRTFRRLPILVLDISRGRRTSLVAPFPLRRCVFSFSHEGLGRVADSLLSSPISPRASRAERLVIMRRLAALLRAQRRWRADLTQPINHIPIPHPRCMPNRLR